MNLYSGDMPAIASLHAKEILDSQGNPALHVALVLDTGLTVETSVPNSSKQYPQEAAVLLDKNPDHMGGKGVRKAVGIIHQTIAPHLIGQDPANQAEIDQQLIQLDGTALKTKLGANTLTGVSQAVMKAAAATAGIPVYQYLLERYQLTDHPRIPTCLYGLINGGQYGAGNLDIQEFIVIPATHTDYRLSLEIENTLRQALLEVLREKKANYATGALGGFTPFMQKNSGVFELIIEAARRTPYIVSRDFFFGIDAGAENLLERAKYTLRDKPSSYYSDKELQDYYLALREQYNLTYFEDPFVIRDTAAWKNFTSELGSRAKIAGDVITATRPALVQQAIQEQYCNTLVVKPSQIGTLTEAIEAVRLARAAGWSLVVSQRTGETNDYFLADFAVGIGAEFVKFGPVNRGEAVAKYNRLTDLYEIIENVKGNTMSQDTPPTDSIPAPTPAPAVDPAPAPASVPTPVVEPTPAPIIEPTPTTPAEPIAPPAPIAPIAPVPPTQPVAAPAAQDLPTPTLPTTPEPLPTPSLEPMIPEPPAPVSEAPAAPSSTAPLEAQLQETIDSTLAEIGAMPQPPSNDTPTPTEPEPTAS